MAFAILTEELSRDGTLAYEQMLALEDERFVAAVEPESQQMIEQNRGLAASLGIRV